MPTESVFNIGFVANYLPEFSMDTMHDDVYLKTKTSTMHVATEHTQLIF